MAFGVVVLVVVGLIAFVIMISGHSEKRIKNHPMIGKVFSAGAPVFYMEDCNNFTSCGETKRDKEVNRSLVCNELNSTVTPIYNKTYEISEQTTFKLIELLEIKSRGLMAMGGAGYVVAVLEDDKERLSTYLFSSLGRMDDPYYFHNDEVCTESTT